MRVLRCQGNTPGIAQSDRGDEIKRRKQNIEGETALSGDGLGARDICDKINEVASFVRAYDGLDPFPVYSAREPLSDSICFHWALPDSEMTRDAKMHAAIIRRFGEEIRSFFNPKLFSPNN